jgi:tetrahydromethanopterin S-methyltransferase subunit F
LVGDGCEQRRLQHVIKKAGMRGQIFMIIFLLVLLGILCALAFS